MPTYTLRKGFCVRKRNAIDPAAPAQEVNLMRCVPLLLKGTWCSGITSASHAEGPGFKSQCVHFLMRANVPTQKRYCFDAKRKSDPGRTRTCNRCFVSQPKRIGRARTNALSTWPQGQAHARKATPAGFEPAYVGFTVAPTPRGRGATNVCQNGKRIQCLIHSATGSSDHSKQRERRPWQDSNLQSLSDPSRDGRDVPMPYPFGHRVKCKDATRELQIGKEAGPGV